MTLDPRALTPASQALFRAAVAGGRDPEYTYRVLLSKDDWRGFLTGDYPPDSPRSPHHADWKRRLKYRPKELRPPGWGG